jgi:hypothetical protein
MNPFGGPYGEPRGRMAAEGIPGGVHIHSSAELREVHEVDVMTQASACVLCLGQSSICRPGPSRAQTATSSSRSVTRVQSARIRERARLAIGPRRM